MLFFFHLCVVSLNMYTLWYDQMYVELPFPSKEFEAMPYKARAIFLTFWCLMLQTIYFSIALLNDIIGTNATAPKNPPIIRKIKDTVFSLAFPIALYVSLTFWGIYAVDKDLIFPDKIEKLFPVWSNHTMHTLILPFIVIELVFSKRNYPSRTVGVALALTFNMAYTVWLHILYFRTGVWVYPFLAFLNWPLRSLFCAISTIMGLGVYILGEKANYFVSPRKEKLYTNGAMKKH